VIPNSNKERRAFECWSWVSDGMWKHRQKELIVTVKRLEGETQPPDGPVQFLQLVYQFAEEGNIVDEGKILLLISKNTQII